MPLPEAARRRARPHARLFAALLSVAVVVGLSTVPASADPPPSPAQIEAKRAEAARLQADAEAQLGVIASAKSTQQTLAGQAATALQELRAAQSAEAAAAASADAARSAEAAARAVEAEALAVEAQARAVEARAVEVETGLQERLGIATAERDASLAAVQRYTAAVYRGGYTAGVGQLIPLLEANSPNEFAGRLEMWGRTGDSQGRLLDELEEKQAKIDALEQQAEDARVEAEDARAQAEAARAEAETQHAIAEQLRGEAEAAEARAAALRGQAADAKARADSLAAQAQAAVRSATATQASTANQAAGAASAAAVMQAARDKYLADEAARVQRERRAGIPSIGSGQDGGTAGCGNPFTATRGGYRNGCIPLSALSKLSFYNSHYLRADAAAAFNRMNEAYQQAFGAPISVTDSYRSYPQQVALKIQKPVLAARAGTSNHGWGVAVDLGGGINSFGTTTHNWMRANAGAFGWVHPAWAQQGGSKPEAWHWEYAG